jgi:hypothetical protein
MQVLGQLLHLVALVVPLVGYCRLAMLLVVLLMVLLLHVLMPVGSRLLAFARTWLQLAVLVHVAVLRGWVLVLVGDRLLPLLVGPSVL